MRILEKYTIKSFMPPMIYCAIAFIFMYMITDLFGHLDEILRNKVGLGLLIEYYYLLIPIIFVQVIPIAILLAVVYVFSNMNRHNEITAMKSTGINVMGIAKPFLLLGIAASLAVMLINEMLVPRANVITKKIKQDYIERIKGAVKKDAVLKDVALYAQDNRLFYIKEFDTVKRKLNEIIILEHDPLNNIKTKIVAKSGRWEKNKWVFLNCIIYNLDYNGEVLGKPEVYTRKAMDFKETPADFYRGQYQADLMNFSQLAEYVRKFYKVDKRIARQIAVDLYYKTSFPFISFIVVLLGIGFGLNTRRGGALWGIGTSIGISFLYYGVMDICLALGKGGWLPAGLAAWSANILFFGLGFILLARLNAS